MCTPSSFLRSIVAVHGLNPSNKKDHAFKTWAKNGHCWLRDNLPADLPNARVFIYEYGSFPVMSDQKQRLVYEALDLLNLIDSHRDDEKPVGVELPPWTMSHASIPVN